MFVQYIRARSVHFRVYSALGGIMSTSENVYYILGYHYACGRYPKDSGGYHAYIRGHHYACGGYHECIGGGGVLWVNFWVFIILGYST